MLKKKKEQLEQLLKQYNSLQQTLQQLQQEILKTQGGIDVLEEQEKLKKEK